MIFNGEVINFDSSNRSYAIDFKISSDKLIINGGKANVQLKIGDTKVNIQNADNYSLDDEMQRFLKNKFLETIYNYNKTKISSLSESYK